MIELLVRLFDTGRLIGIESLLPDGTRGVSGGFMEINGVCTVPKGSLKEFIQS